jgi:homospermidine synthase
MRDEGSPPNWPVHGRIAGPIVMIGFGSIGRGLLPLLERHIRFDRRRMVVVDPDDAHRAVLDELGIGFVRQAVTRDNFRELLTPLLTAGAGRGFCVNLSVDVGSADVIELCGELDVLYIDTVNEPWPGWYFDASLDPRSRTNHALREATLAVGRRRPGTATAVSCCGANPGMVSWFVKQAIVDLAAAQGIPTDPSTRDEWAALADQLGVTGIHIAERDTQVARSPKSIGTFVNTWSVEGFISEGLQPAELGWGTHERWEPPNIGHHELDGAAVFLLQPGADTRVRSWTPTAGPQHGYLVTHNESISIADYLTVRDDDGVARYRPTCHYAYRPCDDAVLSLHEMFGRAGVAQQRHVVLDVADIVTGIDELGVLLYGHADNAYWYGSQLSIEEARSLAPLQNATGLQVTSAVLAGIVWALEHPDEGLVETEQMDFRRCLEIQRPYLGPVIGVYTDWTPLTDRPGLFAEDVDRDDPWQFRNVLVH